MKEVQLPQGTIRYEDEGTGEPIVFVHGAFVDGTLWRKVVPGLARDFRVIVPDLPLGAHRVAMNPDADLTPHGLAKLIDDFLAALDVDGVTLVGNDTGGALCQMVATRHPERVARLVLTPCDAYEHFPPAAFGYLKPLARIPGGVNVVGRSMTLNAIRNAPLGFGWLAKHGIPNDVSRAWIEGLLTDPGVRRDAGKVLKGLDKRYTLEAAEKLKSFDKPVLLAWAPEAKFFKFAWGERLAQDIPNARLERIENSYTFVSEDNPERVIELIAGFVREPVGAAA